MKGKNFKLMLGALILSLAVVASVPAFAGSSIVGSVAGSANAMIGGQPALNGSTIFSGDSLKVTDGVAVVTLGKGTRAVFGRNSEVLFSREGEGIAAHLSSGSVSIFQPTEEQNGVRVKFDGLTVGPTSGYRTLGEVAMVGDAVTVRTKEGVMSVSDASGKTTQVPAGKSLRMVPTRRAPQAAAGSQHFGNGNALTWAAIAAGGTAAVLAGIGLSRANDAKSAAEDATAAANAANSTAGTAATNASSAAAAATSAGAAANSAAAVANSAGCAIDQLAIDEGFSTLNGWASPYVPPNGQPACVLTYPSGD